MTTDVLPAQSLGRAITSRSGWTRWLLVASVLLPGCASVGDYFKARGRDFVDIIDLKWGSGSGAGVKLEATPFVGPGFLYTYYFAPEQWGRFQRQSSPMFHCGLFGVEGGHGYESVYVLGLNIYLLNPPYFYEENELEYPLATLRFGGEVAVPGGLGGLYVNVGELIDFLIGFSTLDVAGDDPRGRVRVRGDPTFEEEAVEDAPEPDRSSIRIDGAEE